MSADDNGEGTITPTAPRNEFRTRCTFAMACMQAGIAFADLARFGVQVTIPPDNPAALAALNTLQAAIAVLNTTNRTDAGLIVPQ